MFMKKSWLHLSAFFLSFQLDIVSLVFKSSYLTVTSSDTEVKLIKEKKPNVFIPISSETVEDRYVVKE